MPSCRCWYDYGEAGTVEVMPDCPVHGSRKGDQMTSKERDARIEALNEAAEHLEQSWTDDAEERRQGEIVAAQLRRQIDRLMKGMEQ